MHQRVGSGLEGEVEHGLGGVERHDGFAEQREVQPGATPEVGAAPHRAPPLPPGRSRASAKRGGRRARHSAACSS